MKLHTLFIVLLSTLILTLNGCGGGSSDTSDPTDPTTPNIKITITDDYQVESLGTANTINATVSLGSTPKDLYLVLSNYATTSASSTITHNAKVVEPEAQSKSISPTHFMKKPIFLRTPQYVQDFSPKLAKLLSKTQTSQARAKTIAVSERNEDVEGTQDSFCVNINNDGSCKESTTATTRKVIPNVTTNLGSKTLNIWVSDDSFGNPPECTKSKCVTQEMVDALADTFLISGLDNDIYDWVTNIYEEEWENDTNGYTGLISANDEITILLTDIDGDDSSSGGVIGFFWSKDNFEKSSISGSNERIMFYADAVMFANGEGTWSIDDFWPKEMVSTLAHEFQHMINFYQKRILLDTDLNVWINEMLSETTEDLIATKIQHIGPRGVEYTDGSAGETGNDK
jgi:hypothetical protein